MLEEQSLGVMADNGRSTCFAQHNTIKIKIMRGTGRLLVFSAKAGWFGDLGNPMIAYRPSLLVFMKYRETSRVNPRLSFVHKNAAVVDEVDFNWLGDGGGGGGIPETAKRGPRECDFLANFFHSPYWCGKERRILIGPW